MKAVFFRVPGGFGPVRLKKAMATRFAKVALEKGPPAVLSVHDTFDWRLYQKGMVLVHSKGTLQLMALDTGQAIAAMVFSGETPPRFWRQYPAGELREALSGALGVRGLMPRFSVTAKATIASLLNAEKKTVLRMSLEVLAAGEGRVFSTLTLHPIRGYRHEKAEAMAICAGEGCFQLDRHPLVAALEEAGAAPGGYRPKPDLPLAPETPAIAAVEMILKHLAGVMRANEDGLRRDIDTEFLHDFRVAVRRSRSLLSLVKGVLPPLVSDRLKSDLRVAGKATNIQRDLDVYLLDQGAYEHLLPETLRPALKPLFATVHRRRGAAFRRTLAYLDTEGYRQTLHHLEDTGGVDGDAPQARVPVVDTARRVITARYKKVVGTGRAITRSTPDREIHRLRIECKKLRYALEFFGALFPATDMARLVTQLKQLQDHLGRFNDLAVQQQFLAAYLTGLKASAPGTVATAAATGGLIGVLHHQQRALREGFPEAFAAFDSPDNAARYEALAAGKEPPA